jgi:hypothetical protein
MFSLAAARRLLDGDLTPDAITSFIRTTQFPLSALSDVRQEMAARSPEQTIPALTSGHIRPCIAGSFLGGPWPHLLDSISAALLYAHSVAIFDPFDIYPDHVPYSSEREKAIALHGLHGLAIIAPLLEKQVVVLVPRDLLPKVTLDFRRADSRLAGIRAQLRAILTANDEIELQLRPRVARLIDDLELLAQTGWSVQMRPPRFDQLGPLSRYAHEILLKDARRHLMTKHLRTALLSKFDAFAIDTLTRFPVPDLAELTVSDIQRIRDEDAFGAWRIELTGVIAEYDRNLDTVDASAASIASERLIDSIDSVDRAIAASSALSALRAGAATFGVAGSAALAAFPIMSVDGRGDALGIAVGSSLIETGRRLVFCAVQRDARQIALSQRQHRLAAASVFESPSSSS